MSTTDRKPVPAVQGAILIFEFLRSGGNAPQTLSAIARGAEMNLSTCFNILKTLEGGHLVAFDSVTKTYRLGFGFVELAAMVDGAGQSRSLALEEARRITDEVGLGCFLMVFTGRDAFIVLDKIESKNPIRTTIDVGAVFPSAGTIAAKAWFAWEPEDVIIDAIRNRELPAYTAKSITVVSEFERELAKVREHGYATSVGEYFPDHNAVAAPVFGRNGAPLFLFVVVGTTSQLSPELMARVGEEVAAGAARATARIGGRSPQSTT